MSVAPQRFSRLVWVITAGVVTAVSAWRMAGWERHPSLMRIEDISYLRTAYVERYFATRDIAGFKNSTELLGQVGAPAGVLDFDTKSSSEFLSLATTSLPFIDYNQEAAYSTMTNEWRDISPKDFIDIGETPFPGGPSTNSLTVFLLDTPSLSINPSPDVVWLDSEAWRFPNAASTTNIWWEGTIVTNGFPEPFMYHRSYLATTNVLAVAANLYPRYSVVGNKHPFNFLYNGWEETSLGQRKYGTVVGNEEWEDYIPEEITYYVAKGYRGSLWTVSMERDTHIVLLITDEGKITDLVIEEEHYIGRTTPLQQYVAPAMNVLYFDPESEFFCVKSCKVVLHAFASGGADTEAPTGEALTFFSSFLNSIDTPLSWSTPQIIGGGDPGWFHESESFLVVDALPTSPGEEGYPLWKFEFDFKPTKTHISGGFSDYDLEEETGVTRYASAQCSVVGIITEFDFETYTLDPPPDDTPYFVP